MLAAERARRLRLLGQQRPQARVHPLDVLVGERVAQHRVDAVEDVVDVGPARGRVRQVEVPVGVGGADDPVPAPGDHEEHALLGAQDQPGVRRDAVARDDEVHSLGRPHVDAPAADELLQLVGPHAGRVDHLAGADGDVGAVLQVACDHADDPLADPLEVQHAGAGGDGRPVQRGGPRDGHRVARVVDLAVVVLDAADHRVLAQRRDEAQHAPPGQVAVARHAPRAAEGVVEDHPGAQVRALPDAVLERRQERDRLDEVRRQAVEQQAALAQRLADEPELELLEIAQAAVDQLARPARRARGEVALLDERDPQPARSRVERRAAADDAPRR